MKTAAINPKGLNFEEGLRKMLATPAPSSKPKKTAKKDRRKKR